MKEKKVVLVAFATLIGIVLFAYLGSLGVQYFRSWKVSYSNILLLESQNINNPNKQITLAEQARFLNNTDETNYNLARIADKAGNYKIAEEAFSQIKDMSKIEFWRDLDKPEGVKYLLIYDELRTNYPQFAFRYLEHEAGKQILTREGYLILSEEYFQHNNYTKAREFAVRAKDLDPYNPQTYQQLVKIEESSGNTTKAKEYSDYLNTLKW